MRKRKVYEKESQGFYSGDINGNAIRGGDRCGGGGGGGYATEAFNVGFARAMMLPYYQ